MTKRKNAHIKIGFLVGVAGFFVVSFASFGGSFCGGLFSSIAVGVVAGLLTARFTEMGVWDEPSRFGGMAGSIAGVFALLGQIWGSILPFVLVDLLASSGILPAPEMDISGELSFVSLLPTLLSGIINWIAAAIAGSSAASRSYKK